VEHLCLEILDEKSDELHFSNATKADPEQNISNFASVDSLSSQQCLTFQLLGPPRAIGQHDEDRVARCFPADAIQSEQVKASQLDRGSSFKLSLGKWKRDIETLTNMSDMSRS
jgi:hypothetical protein